MLDLLRTRRSTRKFRPEPISPEIIEKLEETALRSPSSRSINPWEFIFVDQPELLAKLSKAKQHGADFIGNASLAIVVCADSTKTDVWVEDCSIAAILLQMTAHAEGLGSCWAQIRNRQHDEVQSAENYVQQLLGLPETVKVECIIGIGHPDEKHPPIPLENLQRNKIRRNHWS